MPRPARVGNLILEFDNSRVYEITPELIVSLSPENRQVLLKEP